jgi:hypothetical protein
MVDGRLKDSIPAASILFVPTMLLRSRRAPSGFIPKTSQQEPKASHPINGLDVQAIFRRRRHQARSPPLAKIRPGSPAPTMRPEERDFSVENAMASPWWRA